MKQEPGLTWISSDPGICPILHQLQEHAIFCDVSLLDDAGTSLQAHACVLAAGSPVLRNTLMLKQSRALLKKQGLTLRIAGVTRDIWSVILQFLYVNKVDIDSDLNVIHNVHRVAKMLGIKALESLIVMHVEELALQLPLSGDIASVNVTVAPTVARQHQHRQTQTDPPVTPVQPVGNPLTQSHGINTDSQSILKMVQMTQNAGDSLQSPPAKRLKVISSAEQTQVTGTLQTDDIQNAYPVIPRETQEEIITEENVVEEESYEGPELVHHMPLEQTPKKTEGSINMLACRYCGMVFDKRIALVDHVVESCRKIFKDRKFHKTRTARMTHSEEFDDLGGTSLLKFIKQENLEEIPGTSIYHCISDECPESSPSHAAHMKHLMECVMAGPFINPKSHVNDVKGTLTYEDGLQDLPEDAIERPAATLADVSSNVKMYSCNHCKLRGVRERMAVHLAIVHGKRKPYRCKKCPAKYGYFESFRDHYISSHTNQTFPCEELGCDAVFHKKDALRRHVLMDHKREGKEMHECRGCGKTFKYAHHARRHEKYHMGKEERPFVCATCKKAFVTKQDLQRHKDIHTGCKPFKCSQCFYTTARKSNLILHERKHGVVHGEYVCTTCMKYFISETRFKAHLNALKHEGCRVDELPNHVVMYPNEDQQERVVYQNAVEFDGTNTTPLTVERVANPDGELQVVPIESMASDPALAQGVQAALGGNNLVYVVTTGDDLVFNVVDTQNVMNTS